MFGEFNNIDLSIYNHIKTLLVASGIGSGGVSGTFMDAYPSEDQIKNIKSISDLDPDNIENEIIMPVITLEEGEASLQVIEIGSKNRGLSQPFIMSVFAESKRQLNNLMSQLIFDVDREIDYRDYESNFNNPPLVGKLWINPESIRAFRVRDLSPIQQVRHRGEIIFEVSTK